MLVGALTAVSALAGVWITQWRSDKREAVRMAVEEARLDVARVFDHRREAYLQFLSQATAMRRASDELDGTEPRPRMLVPLWDQLTAVTIYGSTEAADAAAALYDAVYEDFYGDKDLSGVRFEYFQRQFMRCVRRDLKVDDTGHPEEGRHYRESSEEGD
jgi:hypothetical protein